MDKLTGGCACGAVRYTITEEPYFSFHCQCRQCQRSTGTGHASQFSVPANAVNFTGEIKFYTQQADDASSVSRGFCPQCGSPIMGKTTGYKDILFIHAASLDDPALFKPQKVVWSEFGQPWDYVDPDLPKS